jgi:hypothetical protein
MIIILSASPFLVVGDINQTPFKEIKEKQLLYYRALMSSPSLSLPTTLLS